jgi:hypothetical protein
MRTIKKAQFGDRVGRARGQKCGLEKAQRREDRMYEKENRRADRQADREMKREARKAPKAKKGGSFPDLNKDGKITKADILKGRGVIAKRGVKVKKAQQGARVSDPMSRREIDPVRPKRLPKGTTNKGSLSIKGQIKKGLDPTKTISPKKRLRVGGTLSPSISSVSKRLGSSKKLRGGGTLAPTKSSTSRRLSSAHTRKAMGGMKMGKCKYGC